MKDTIAEYLRIVIVCLVIAVTLLIIPSIMPMLGSAINSKNEEQIVMHDAGVKVIEQEDENEKTPFIMTP